jgi:hypothetical protein
VIYLAFDRLAQRLGQKTAPLSDEGPEGAPGEAPA